MKQFTTLLLILSCLIFASCSHKDGNTAVVQSKRLSKECKVEDVIKDHFDKKVLKYRMYTDEDSVVTFELGFKGDYGRNLHLNVSIDYDASMYEIICHTDTQIPQEALTNGIKAINNYNLSARVVSGCIGPKGSIYFWMGRNIDGCTFSEEAFAADCAMVLQATDEETERLCKRLCL